MLDNSLCPICNSKIKFREETPRDSIRIACNRCGRFEIIKSAIVMFEQSKIEDKILSVSYWISQNQSIGDYVHIDIVKLRPLLIPFVSPKPKEQANKLLFWIGDKFPKPNDEIDFELNDLISVIGAYNANGVDYICRFLINEGIFDKADISPYSESGSFSGILSFKGWDSYFQLQYYNKDSRLAFMAMQYDNIILQRIYRDVIIDAVKQTGFEIRKLDEEKRAGLIDDKLRVEIRRSKFIIADLTDENRGAYWEAGYAEGLGMQVIYICEESKFEKDKPHFDTNHHLTITWKNTKEELEKFAAELKTTIRATFPTEAKMED